MINVETSRTIRVFEGHQGAVSSLAVHKVIGSECQVAESRHLIQTLCPVWNEPDEDVFEFELTSTKKIISVRAFDWNRMGQHDFIGNFELGLEEDILVGKAVENPVITCWYPLHYKGISRGRGKLKLEFRCNIYLATNTVPRLAYDSGNFQSSKRSVSNSHILNRVMHRWSNRYMKLTVKLVAGKELPRMDRFGLCDPFVKIKITDKPVVHLFSGSFDTKAHMWDIKTVCSRVPVKLTDSIPLRLLCVSNPLLFCVSH
jgi:hypothetical protein